MNDKLSGKVLFVAVACRFAKGCVPCEMFDERGNAIIEVHLEDERCHLLGIGSPSRCGQCGEMIRSSILALFPSFAEAQKRAVFLNHLHKIGELKSDDIRLIQVMRQNSYIN